MQLKTLMVDTKEAWVDFPGLTGFSVLVVNLSRKELTGLRKRCVETKYDRRTRQPIEELNEEKFISEFTKATIKGWRGLKLKYLEQLLLVEIPKGKEDSELEYGQENAEELVTNSADFDTWLNEVVFDLDNFRGNGETGAVEAPGKVA